MSARFRPTDAFVDESVRGQRYVKGCVVAEAQSQRVDRLVIESRQDDSDDARTITRARRPFPSLVFEHRTARREPMLGLADGITWAAGAGKQWRALIDPLVHRVVELRP